MNEQKADAYKKLIENIKGRYPVYAGQSPIKKVELFAPVINGATFCKEINLYTYWQGFGYAEKTPEIKYLLVAQDWGNPFKDENKYFMERIQKMNNGDKTASYFVDDDKIYITDKNLAELFEVLGYKNIMTQRYDDLFFTNLCLGYRIGKEGGGMTDELLTHDSKKFKELVDILEPKNILCLGRKTAECAYKVLTGENLKIDNYNKFLNNPTKFTVKVGNIVAKFYPLAHCGGMGTANRNRNLPKHNDSLYYQKQDWKKVAEDNI